MHKISIHECLQEACILLANVSNEAKLEAELLLGMVLQKPRSYLYAWPEKCLEETVLQDFKRFLNRRMRKEPLAYIIGKQAFWNLKLVVTTDTLIPRPETELLVETILNRFPMSTTLRVADLGTGTGAIVLALAQERPHWLFHATDQCEKSLAVAKLNASRYHVHSINFHQGDWCKALPTLTFDLIVSNPPYISAVEWPNYEAGLQYEPRAALISGEDGLDALQKIVLTAKTYLKPGGVLLVEHGFQQGEAVRKLFTNANYKAIQTITDFSKHERGTLGDVA